MSEAAPPRAPTPAPGHKMFTELRVSGHLMALETGLFCIVQTPGQRRPEDGSGLPGVRISLAPGPLSRPHAVSISTFRPDGWLSGASDAALVRVSEGPAQVLVTIYQAPGGPENAPRLQVLRLAEEPAALRAAPEARLPEARLAPVPARPGTPAAPLSQAPVQRGRPGAPASGNVPLSPSTGPSAAPFPARGGAEIMAHVQIRGDIGAMLGEWVGERGSKRWIEGFVLAPRAEVAAADIEYQALLGRGWLSPWVEGGQLCGSRGMALPLLGIRMRLRGAAAETHVCSYSATFVDGTTMGPVTDGAACEAESMAPLEAFQIVLQRRQKAPIEVASAPAKKPRPAAPPAKPSRAASRPAPGKPGKAKPAPPRRGR